MRAFVLGGGGARGALQVGALRALLEADVKPELLVGTSIGAVNAAYLAMHGCTLEALAGLEAAWRDAAEADLLPDNYLWLTVRALFNRRGSDVQQRMRDFCVDHGLEPDLHFGQLRGPRLILVAADLVAGCPVLYGTDPNDLILDGALASSAIPPWVRPLAQKDQLLIDGGAVSNLPIEPALSQGATEIVALDLTDPRPVRLAAHGPGAFFYQLLCTVQRRQIQLEIQLAAARGVPVHHLQLRPESPMAIWEFPRAAALFEPGHALAQRYLAEHPGLRASAARPPWWRRLWQRWLGSTGIIP